MFVLLYVLCSLIKHFAMFFLFCRYLIICVDSFLNSKSRISLSLSLCFLRSKYSYIVLEYGKDTERDTDNSREEDRTVHKNHCLGISTWHPCTVCWRESDVVGPGGPSLSMAICRPHACVPPQTSSHSRFSSISSYMQEMLSCRPE